ncbi:autotransporter [Brucella endophytica]|uniref:Autotransporter n=1 Tax=Brucella endophytica TaxID=1963359 RepID=A0A916SGD3_9HYPH|nr:autotransporter [Brucella endophytica]
MAQEAYLNKDVPAYVDTGATNQRGDARYATKETNAAVRLLSGFLDIWEPRSPFVDAGQGAPARDGFPAVPISDWDGIPGSATDGRILNQAIHDHNIDYVVKSTQNRTDAEAVQAYLDDRRGKGYSVIDGLGPLRDAWVRGTGQFTTIVDVPADATTVKYDDKGNNIGIGSASNPNLGLAVDLIAAMGKDASTEPAKRYFKYARPYRWSDQVVVVPALEPAKSSTPATDGGFTSGHTAEGWRDALAMAYLVPQRFQEMITRAVVMGDSRIVAGMHSPLDVMSGRMLGIASVVYNLNLPENQNLKQAAFEQTQEWLKKETDSTTAADLFVAAHAADLAVDRFADREANARYVADRMSYGFEQFTKEDAKGKPPVVPKGAEVLLETRFPYLNADQRRTVLASTELPSGIPVLDDPEGYGRLDLFKAADGYGWFDGDVTVDMDKQKDGFNAFDAWRNNISGNGRLTKLGTGTLMLTGNNSYSGGTQVSGGMLVGTNGHAFGKNSIQVDKDGQLVLNTPFNDTMSNDLTGTGTFEKRGTGSVLYMGNGSGFTGTTMINGGTLLVGDEDHSGASLGGIINVAGGTLGGTGTIGSTTVSAGGVLAPGGGGIGTLDIVGDLTFEKGSIYNVDVDPEGAASDLVDVTGVANLEGGSVAHIGANGNYRLRSTYTILSAGTLNGAFEGVTSNFAFLTPELSYDYGQGTVDLELNRNDRTFASMARTRNQTAVAGGIESIGFNAESPVYDAVAQLPNDDELIQDSYDQLSGEIHASATTALINDSRLIRNAVNDRLRAAFDDVAAADVPVLGYGPDAKPLAKGETPQMAAWGQAFGAWSKTDGDGNAADLDQSTGGFVTGFDTMVATDWRLGAFAGYSRTSFDARGSGESDNYHVGVYGGGHFGALSIRSGLGYSRHSVETSRVVAFAGFEDRLKADYDAGTFQAFGELGYRIDMKQVAFEPFANLAHVRVKTDGFTETGGAAALSAAEETTSTTFTTLGLRASAPFTLGTVEAEARGTVGWQHAYGDTTPVSTLAFDGGNGFSVAGVPLAEDMGLVEAGFDVKLSERTTLGVSYTGQFGSDVKQNGVDARFAVKF